MKIYNQAPLPFQGQKRRFVKPFKEALKSFPNDAIYVDLFGGSGLLSHTVKSVYPEAKVIYNDFDNYSERLKNIPKTNKILANIRNILKDEPRKRVDGEKRKQILDLLKAEKGFVDYITLSGSILFSANYVTCLEDLEKVSIYNNTKKTHYESEQYLKGVERVQMDYRDLYSLYKNTENVVFLIDPPYLSTDTKTYHNMDYWKLTDYLSILNLLEDKPYFYFTSEKSQVIELAEWMSENGFKRSPFDESTKVIIHTSLNYGAKYNDIMIYKNNYEKQILSNFRENFKKGQNSE